MSRSRIPPDLYLRRSWVWTADAERRWLRAFRLLLSSEPATDVAIARTEESDVCTASRLVRAGLDRAAGRESNDRAATGAPPRLCRAASVAPRPRADLPGRRRQRRPPRPAGARSAARC